MSGAVGGNSVCADGGGGLLPLTARVCVRRFLVLCECAQGFSFFHSYSQYFSVSCETILAPSELSFFPELELLSFPQRKASSSELKRDNLALKL